MEVKKGFTLVEMMVVIVIIGILATIGLTQYTSTREKTLDKEAFSNLKMIRAAQKSYNMDWGNYYPAPVSNSNISDSNITTINSKLKLFLHSGSNRSWNYTVNSTGCSQADRYNGPARSWNLTIDNDGDPINGTCQ